MCMEDVRIARQALWTESQAAIGIASAQILASAPNTFSIIFSPPASGTVTVSTISPVVSLAGFLLSAGIPPLKLNLLFDGAIVTKTWFGIGSVATTIQIGQSIMPLQ